MAVIHKANFGREHTFRVSQAEYSGGRRFQYGGYWFGFVDAWPSNWLYTQDVFVVEIDGMYYLCNPAYPGVNIALNVTMGRGLVFRLGLKQRVESARVLLWTCAISFWAMASPSDARRRRILDTPAAAP